MEKEILQSAKNALIESNPSKSIDILKQYIQSKDLNLQILNLEVRYNNLKEQINNGTIELKDIQLEENKISSSILSIISDLEHKDETPISSSHNNNNKGKRFDFKWILIGFLSALLFALGYYFITSNKNEPTQATNPCTKIKCENGGKCNQGKCLCPDGFTGKNCETKVVSTDYIMKIEDVFSITGRGLILTGKINTGKIKKGDKIKISGDGKSFSTKCLGIEKLRQQVEIAKEGDNVGILIKGIEKKDLKRGMVITF